MNQRIYLSLTTAKYFLKWNQERLEKAKKKKGLKGSTLSLKWEQRNTAHKVSGELENLFWFHQRI